MLALEFSFTARRFHATPWGSHANEGQPEWPPSPWRILRALVAVWLRATPDVPAADLETLVTSLAAPPSFVLPPGSIGHTRHYLPMDGGHSPTLGFDAFVALSPDENQVVVRWDQVQLAPHQRNLLARLLENVPYLGRAESWCRACLLPHESVPGEDAVNCRPVVSGTASGDGQLVDVLCASPDLSLGHLLVDTGNLRSERRVDPRTPPGSAWQLYVRPRIALPVGLALGRVPGPRPAEVVRFRLDVPVVRGAVGQGPLPSVVETLRVGDLARAAAMSRFGREQGGELSATLSGRYGGTVLEQQHRHAHYLPTDEDGDGRLDHLTVWAPGGLPSREVAALCGLRELRERTQRAEPLLLALTFLGYGSECDLPAQLRGPARVWESVTPFVLTRHPKTHRGATGRVFKSDSPTDQVLAELRHRGRPTARVVGGITHSPTGRHWLEFHRHRRNQRPPLGGGYGFRLHFDSEVAGPLALGFGAHFGLGLFVPTGNNARAVDPPPAGVR